MFHARTALTTGRRTAGSLRPPTWALLVWIIGHFSVAQVSAQQTTVGTPFNSVSDSFFESFGVNWGFQKSWRNGHMFFNSGGPALPPFGGFNPNGTARFGIGTRGRNGGFSLNFSAAQASSRQINSVTPMVTVPNGGTGFILDTTIRPFVTSLTPVVGSTGPTPRVTSPLRERLDRLGSLPPNDASSSRQPVRVGPAAATQPRLPVPSSSAPSSSAPSSSAERGDISLADIKRRQASSVAYEQHRLNQLIAEAEAAAESGRLGAARVRYSRAAAEATGALRVELLDRLEELREK